MPSRGGGEGSVAFGRGIVCARLPVKISDFAETFNEIENTKSHDCARQRLYAWVYWTAEAADVRAQLIAFVPFTTTGAGQKHEPKNYGSHDEKKPVLHGF